ncbi:hypothetical protein [Actinoplanes sp. NPDC051494]|uniref:hypothetical protein n=1 Tax=Actinoplanes sp. NPDC051494 TaxID=3363907 RepID=UPI0037A261C5
MTRSVRLAAALGVGWAGAALWAHGAVILQPLAEPGSRWWGYAENNSYWPREVRWGAVVAVAVVLFAVADTGRRRGRTVTAGALLWIGADVALDRADPGHAALIPAAVLAGAAITATALWLCRTSDRAGISGLPAVLCLLAAFSLLTLESPTDEEPELVPSATAGYLLFAVAALVCVLAALPGTWSRRRQGLVLVIGATGLSLALVPGPFAADAVLCLALVAATAVVTRPWTGPARALGVALAHGLILPGVLMFALVTLLEAARPFTALAGNPPINSADSDPSIVLVVVVATLVWAGLGRLFMVVTAELHPEPEPAAGKPATSWEAA